MSEQAINILIAGEAGQGLATIGQLMSKALVRGGYEIHVTQEYLSRIRGGINSFAIRTGPEPVYAPVERVDIFVALNEEAVGNYADLLHDESIVVVGEGNEAECIGHRLRVPFKELAPKKIFHNTVALGVLGASICKDRAILEKLLENTFAKKGQEVVDANVEVLRNAYQWAQDQDVAFTCMPPAAEGKQGRMMLNGNEAIALGAMAAGCNFCSFYPMTPATSIALTLINKGREVGLVVEQVEDEIAAINMALGASFAGARPIVTTSGGGFALMIEGVSLAGIIETPVVIALAQRPGPATGLPTRTEQADLNMVLYAGHGEFPRAVFAPGTTEECIDLTHRAFQQAERWQTPCFVLTDQYLADSYRAVDMVDTTSLPEIPGPVLEPENPEDYARYALSEDGVSPRVVPGFSKALVKADSDEHTPAGVITEDPEMRVLQQNKRLTKGVGMLADVVPPEYYGDEDAELLLVCWGSSLGPCLEAMELHDAKAAVLHFKQVWPLKEDQFMEYLDDKKRVVAVEGNSTGQFARLLRQETGFTINDFILRYDGYPLTARYIKAGLDSIL